MASLVGRVIAKFSGRVFAPREAENPTAAWATPQVPTGRDLSQWSPPNWIKSRNFAITFALAL